MPGVQEGSRVCRQRSQRQSATSCGHDTTKSSRISCSRLLTSYKSDTRRLLRTLVAHSTFILNPPEPLRSRHAHLHLPRDRFHTSRRRVQRRSCGAAGESTLLVPQRSKCNRSLPRDVSLLLSAAFREGMSFSFLALSRDSDACCASGPHLWSGS